MIVRSLLLASALLAAGCSTPPATLDLSLDKQTAAGRYRVAVQPPQPRPAINQLEGMKFSMTGWWELKLAIDAPAGPDQVTFNTVVDVARK